MTPGTSGLPLYGLTRFRDLFTPRQLATLCAFAQGVREAHAEMLADGMEPAAGGGGVRVPRAGARPRRGPVQQLCAAGTRAIRRLTNTYARQALPMVWDFAEANPFGGAAGGRCGVRRTTSPSIVEQLAATGRRVRGPAHFGHAATRSRRPFRRGHHRPAVLRQHLLRRPVGLLLRLAEALGRVPVRGALRGRADAEEARGDRGAVPARRRQVRGAGVLRAARWRPRSPRRTAC